ncbi:MAG: DUF1294 domain-containing protein [Lachnospiraceae bacterium]|nr:DUF1294 domain-containing protein [Lachnospiraceae bacterium]
MSVLKIIIYYLIAMNLAGFLFMGIDKWKAKKRAWRIPEATLLLIAAIGGAAGSMLGMHLFHHKTRHWYFLYGIPVMLALHILLFFFIWKGPVQFILL